MQFWTNLSCYNTFMDTLLTILSESRGISTDSRDEMRGKVFFALPKKNNNSYKFAIHALSKGALCAVVDNEKILKKASRSDLKKLFFVEDVTLTLREIEKYHKS